ncbi:thiamine ABC transporter substrate binding subunit [Roseovarius indicus]|uniref:thiamine ABC transporter substrate binding subunit n=1 Tax=Roseovarius indicus TaxID=540747 RepID=UPI0007D950E1|nr:thiamine ABC transporter substrate binding subunit [Roseovarius indicus]OAO06068.1 thiamine ABC transporter substrate binding subunit [Roseovarius indicus]
MKHLTFAAGLLCATATSAQTPELTVYTYDSFVAEWGPGPKIEAAFEETCDCDLKLVGVEDGAALLARVRLEGDRSDADIVLGLDTNLIAAAKETGLFAEHSVDATYDMPVEWTDPVFVPYDWGYFAFIHEAANDAPTSFRALADSEKTILIQDPRSSTPGLGLLLWVKAAYGDEAPDIWAGLSDNIVTVTKGWSEAYGLFMEGEADMVLSYTTSPAYHLIAEEDDTKAAAPFDEGHYMQVEVAGKLASTDQPELADEFLQFMVSNEFQSVIPTTNWMYPAVMPDDGLADGFDTLIKPEKSLLLPAEDAAAIREEALTEWQNALSQ